MKNSIRFILVASLALSATLLADELDQRIFGGGAKAFANASRASLSQVPETMVKLPVRCARRSTWRSSDGTVDHFTYLSNFSSWSMQMQQVGDTVTGVNFANVTMGWVDTAEYHFVDDESAGLSYRSGQDLVSAEIRRFNASGKQAGWIFRTLYRYTPTSSDPDLTEDEDYCWTF